MGKLVGKLLWMIVGSAASRMARNYTRKTLYTRGGAPRLPRRARRQSGVGMMLGWAVATGAIMALADLLQDQGKDSIHAR